MSEPKRLKICVYAIAKNEEKFVERFCESARGADLIIIADTGSTDRTVELAKECGASVFEICVNPWRFDKARDVALGLVPADVDVCVSIDLDEVLELGWREEIEKVWFEGATRLRYGYDWGCGIRFNADKIHARKGYFWHHPCHELLRPDPRTKEVFAETNNLLVTHLPDDQKSRGTYLELLEMSVKEDKHCPRNSFYLARELYFRGRTDEAIAECKRYLELPDATWHHERCYALRVIGKCYEGRGLFAEAEGWYQKAAAEAPFTREPWCALALLYYRQAKWAESFAAATRALGITVREWVYTVDPECWKAMPHDLASIAAWNLGMKEEAIRHTKAALEIEPENARIANNLKLMSPVVSPTTGEEFGWAS